METIIKEKLVPFKELEQKIYAYVCELARGMTRIMLESYDDEIAASRDTRQYRDKGRRGTSIKTVYGEVEYRRRVYRTIQEDGETGYVYLLDEVMQMEGIGLRGKPGRGGQAERESQGVVQVFKQQPGGAAAL